MVGDSCIVSTINLLGIIAVLILLIVLCWVFHIRIDLRSFFRRSFRVKRGLYGTYVFNGEQGKGKTLSLATYVYKHRKDNYIIFSNVYFNCLDSKFYQCFDDFDYVYKIIKAIDDKVIGYKSKDKRQVVIIWDELFSLLNKSTKLNKEIKSFLSQLRKRHIIFLTTCQSWPDIPLEFRRLCRFEIDCNCVPLISRSILINIYKDAERMKWDEIQQEHVAPIVWTRISQVNKCIADSYDTNQTIKASNF